MQLSLNPGHFSTARSNEDIRTEKEIFTLIKAAGFNLVDYDGSISQNIYETAGLLNEVGLKVNQSHSPYNRYKKEDYAEFEKKVIKGIENAHILSSDIYVVHGDEFDFANLTYSREAVLEFNYRIFSPAVEFAAENNMRVAFETVFEEPNANPRFCSETEDLIALVEKFNCKNVGICWDFGHAKVQDPENHLENLKLAGSRVISTHVHDNHHLMDLHLMPFFGDCDWESAMQVLKDINYSGDFTFELVYDKLPMQLLPDQLSLLHKSGEYLLGL